MTDPKLLSDAEFEALCSQASDVHHECDSPSASCPGEFYLAHLRGLRHCTFCGYWPCELSDLVEGLRAERAARVKAEAERDALRMEKALQDADIESRIMGMGIMKMQYSTQGPSRAKVSSPETGFPVRDSEASASLPLGHVFIQHHKGQDYYSGCVSTDLSKMAYCGQPRSAHLPTPPPSPQDDEVWVLFKLNATCDEICRGTLSEVHEASVGMENVAVSKLAAKPLIYSPPIAAPNTQDEERKRLVEELRKASENLRHRYCEDSWYSCPKHEDGCANEADGDACNCGYEQSKALLDRAADLLERDGKRHSSDSDPSMSKA